MISKLSPLIRSRGQQDHESKTGLSFLFFKINPCKATLSLTRVLVGQGREFSV